MKENSGRERMLKLMRNALQLNNINIIQSNSSPYNDEEDDPSVVFAKNFTKERGKFIYCSGEKDFQARLKIFSQYRKWESITCYNQHMYDYLSGSDIKSSLIGDEREPLVGISLCENLVARTNSVILSSVQGIGKRMINFPKTFIIIAFTSQVVRDLQSSFRQMIVRYKNSLPETVLALTYTDSLKHEIEEFYIFLIEDEGIQ